MSVFDKEDKFSFDCLGKKIKTTALHGINGNDVTSCEE